MHHQANGFVDDDEFRCLVHHAEFNRFGLECRLCRIKVGRQRQLLATQQARLGMRHGVVNLESSCLDPTLHAPTRIGREQLGRNAVDAFPCAVHGHLRVQDLSAALLEGSIVVFVVRNR